MGVLKTKYHKHTLCVTYRTSEFEELLPHHIDYVQTLERENSQLFVGEYIDYQCVIDYVTQNITVEIFECILKQIVSILTKLSLDYILLDQCLLDVRQWIIDDHTKTVKFIFLNAMGVVNTLSLQQFIKEILAHSVFDIDESVDILSVYLDESLTLERLKQKLFCEEG